MDQQYRNHGYARHCAQAVNALHSIPYFTADLADEVAPFGITDHSSVYLAGRASVLGPVDPAVVAAVFNSFAPRLISERIPTLWDQISPERALRARENAVAAALERLLGTGIVRSADLSEAAKLATAAAQAGALPGRPLYAANSALDLPERPHVALWHAATMLREHRGDGHVAVLDHFELTGVDSLVIDCASSHGMAKEIVMPMRGWTEDEWSAGRERLADRGLVDAGGELTPRGAALRDEVEAETGRLDRRPYEALGTANVERLARYVHRTVGIAADAGVFPPPLRGFFAPTADAWNAL
ncbi:SCO6745 family protein [Streptomyces sp. NPDC002932]|uniref:SCO6745 family protein n=1 Tax=Streptomyces sp. NPDC002932 TaxID=3364672 RepID=UPI00367E6E9A